MNTPAPSGHQYTLTLGDQHATITEVGASLREYRVGTREVVLPFELDQIAPACSGGVLAPWPNRLRDGQYTFDGTDHQVALTEPARGVALHGLVLFGRFAPDSEPTSTQVSLVHDIVPTAGYPFAVRVRVTYTLTDAGLEIVATASNLGATTAPYGIGFHPWLSPGAGTVDECTLRLDASTRVLVDDRLLPTGEAPVEGEWDLRSPRPMAGLVLDDAFVDVLRDEDGLSWARLAGPDGRVAAVWCDESMDTWQVCTGDGVPGLERRGVALEPMSCIADAFRTGDRLVRLAPGADHTVRWGITLI